MISDLDTSLRLLTAAALGSIVGFERERLLWAAGIRTHMLVSVGSCLLMIVSAYGFQHATLMAHVVLDPSRVAAQVVSGIGFLGAGSILLRGAVVRGLTTAASIWAVAAIGLAAGGGLYFAAVTSTAIILAILAGVKPLEEAYRARVQSCWIHLKTDRGAIDPNRAGKLLQLRQSQLRRIVVKDGPGNGEESVRLQLTRVTARDVQLVTSRLKRATGVRVVEVTRRRRRGEDPARFARETAAEEEALR